MDEIVPNQRRPSQIMIVLVQFSMIHCIKQVTQGIGHDLMSQVGRMIYIMKILLFGYDVTFLLGLVELLDKSILHAHHGQIVMPAHRS